MRRVEPEVFLVAAPMVRWQEMRRYLSSVNAESWLDKAVDKPTSNPGETLIEFGGRMCYRSWEPGLNPNVTRIRENSRDYLGNILSSGHGSVLEHANFSFVFQNVSRVFTHEMVRHRAGVAVSQESMRFVRLTDLPFWFPDWAAADEELMRKAVSLLLHMEEFQTWMSYHFGLDNPKVSFSEKKAKTSFMRRFAPDGVATAMLCTINIRALRHIIYMRTSLGAEEEMRLIFDKVAEICLTEFPNLMQDYSKNEHLEWVPEFLKV